ncbi:tRNA pseudouridine(13) synthase TruD [Rosistilla oblonga]|uniref:tRNA pseudouridine(13) synthase TruD n=1 Tax=Rosistilla oblonga TaxID=2527990 RepID=UPI003A96906D
MNPIDPPRLLGPSLGSVIFKSQPEDFEVEELLRFEPSGEGEHCLVWLEKRHRNTNDVASELATKLGLRKRLISHCGLKDKEAVTRQWFSLHLPGKPSPSAEDLTVEGVRVLRIVRHLRKLHRGAHDGNRFWIRLRGCEFSKEAAAARWQQMIDRGVPNYFGTQRFGRDGGNVPQALRWFKDEIQVRDRMLRGILLSAARSYLFNACVGRRVLDGTWDTPLSGDVFGFPDNRSLVLPHNLHGDEADRVQQGALELTAPLWGDGELQSQAAVKATEEEVVAAYPDLLAGLAQFNLRQERRVMRLRPLSAELTWESDSTLVLRFDLPKGTYATTLLRELVDIG